MRRDILGTTAPPGHVRDRGADSIPGTRALLPRAPISMTLPVGTAQGGVLKFLGQVAWAQVLAPPHPSSVMLGKSLNFSGPQTSPL